MAVIALAFLGFCISELVEAQQKEKKAKKQNGVLNYSLEQPYHDALNAGEGTPLMKRYVNPRRYII